MSTPTWVNKADLREKEVERLMDDARRRISELQLKILSGTLSSAELLEASQQLDTLKHRLSSEIDTSTREATGRRLRPEQKKPF